MNGDKNYNSPSCEIANCNNKATEIIEEQLTNSIDDIGNVYLCRKCKESW